MTFTSYAFADNDDDTGQTEEVPVTAKSQDAIGSVLLQSISLIGIPYRWGGNTPQQGMDCSGFIRYVFKQSLGITLPRTAAEMAKVGKRVSLDDLEPGDLIFFNTTRGSNTHIGMYIGNNKFIQSPHTGADIQITELTSGWRSKINGAKRIVQEDQDDAGQTTVENFQDVHDEALPVRAGYTKRHRSTRRTSTSHHKTQNTGVAKHGHTRSGASHSTTSTSHSNLKHSRKKRNSNSDA